MKSIKIAHGALAPDYELQARRQGYTLGPYGEYCEKLKHYIEILYCSGCITRSEYWKILERMHKKVIVPNLTEVSHD